MTSPAPPDVQDRPGGRWRWLVLAGALLLLPLGLLGLYLYERDSLDREVRDAVAETGRRDPGWRLEDLERNRKALPDEQNAALRVIAVRGLMPSTWPTRTNDSSLDELVADLQPQQQLNDEQQKELRGELDKVKAALERADRLADLPDGRYPIAWPLDFISARIDDAQNSREVANMLRHEVSRRAQDRDMEGACRAELALINTGRSLGEEHTHIVMLIRTALITVATTELERLLAQGEPGEESLAAIQHLLEREEEDTPAVTVAAFRGERALGHRMMDAMEHGRLSISSMTGPPATLGERIGDALNVGMIKHSHAAYLRFMTEAVELAKEPGPEQQARMKELESAPVDRRAVFAVLLIPAATRVMNSVPRKLAYLRSAIVAVALERYRREHGGWPESLDALAPTYLRRVPADPYDGRPLRYRRLPDGVVVYSVGPDGVDNAGHLDRKDPLAEGNDLGFRLWDVLARRQPAPPPRPRYEPPPDAPGPADR